MSVDRGALSRIDRKLLAGLDANEEWRVARLPVSEALWSAWKRYCSAIGISMGRGIAALIQRELEAVIGAEVDVDLLSETEAELRSRERAADHRESQLTERENSLTERERLLSLVWPSRVPASSWDVGRNDRCPCGSGLKYKRCHGLVASRSRRVASRSLAGYPGKAGWRAVQSSISSAGGKGDEQLAGPVEVVGSSLDSLTSLEIQFNL